MRQIILMVGMLLVLAGCSTKVAPPPEKGDVGVLYDLRTYPQDAYRYRDNIVSKSELLAVQQRFEQRWFAPWRYEEAPENLDAVLWPFKVYRRGRSYGENLQPIEPVWFDAMLEKANFQAYDSVKRYGIALHYLSLRNFPTHKPLFRDPEQAGEGFPFDYLQNSGVHANEPLYISHYSKNGAWVYVFSAYATGWVPSDAIALMPKEETQQWMVAKQVFLLEEHVPLHDASGHFLFNGRVGMMLPLKALGDTHVEVLIAIGGAGDLAHYAVATLPRNVVSLEPMLLDSEHLPQLANRMLESHYGWGGMYQERDCSSTLRDMFAPFGIWLPRNSSQQARMGKVIRFDGLSDGEKLERIREEGVPFETLLYRKGHILLYLGTYDGKVMVLHNLWGVKTKEGDDAGRAVVGKAVISTLSIGSELEHYDAESALLKNLESMNIVTAIKP